MPSTSTFSSSWRKRRIRPSSFSRARTLLWCLSFLGTAQYYLTPVNAFANYLLSSSGCYTELDPMEVVMNHPIQAATNHEPLELQLNLPNPDWKVLDPPLDPTQFRQIQVPSLSQQLPQSDSEPLRIPIRIAEKDGQNAGDFQVVLQILSSTKQDEDDPDHDEEDTALLNAAASFDQGSCDGQRRIAGRAMDEYTLLYTNPQYPIRLVAAWAAGHEPVKLLPGFEFTVSTLRDDSSKSSNNNVVSDRAHDAAQEHAEALAESHEDVIHDHEQQQRDQQHLHLWTDSTILQNACQSTTPSFLAGGFLPPSTHLAAMEESSSPPVALEILKERDETSHTTLEISTSVDGPVLFHVSTTASTTKSSSSSSSNLVAHWMSHRALCEDKHLILVNTRDELPVVLQVPSLHNTNQGHVEIQVTAMYADPHDQAIVHPTAALELHWSTENDNKDEHEHSAPKEETEREDPQRELDRKISQDLRAHLEEMKKKHAVDLEQDTSRDHSVFMDDKAKRRAAAQAHHQRDKTHQTAQHEAAKLQSAQAQKARLEAERKDPTTNDLLPPRHHHQYRDLLATHDEEAARKDLPVVTWQDSRYFMGLLILVGGIYGSIVACTIVSQFLQAKGRTE